MTKNGPEVLIGWRDFPLEKDDTWEPKTNLTGSEHMICEFQNQHELDYADRRKSMMEKNVSTALDNTADDIQEARDDNEGDDAKALKEMVVLNSRGLAKETRGASSLCLRPMNPSSQHAKTSGRTLSLGGSQIVREDLELRWVTKIFYLIATLLDPRTKMLSFCDNQ